MKKPALLLIQSLFFCIILNAQTERFDLASFTAPQGWSRSDSNGLLIFQNAKTVDGKTSFCQIFLHKSRNSKGSAMKDFNAAWDELVEKPLKLKSKPLIETEKTGDGWTITKGSAAISWQGLNFVSIVIAATGFNKSMFMQANIAGQDYSQDLETFFANLDLNKSAMTTTNRTGNQTSRYSLSDFNYIVPDQWKVEKTNESVFLIQQLANGPGCYYTIFPSFPGSGNLENDAMGLFNKMYAGWQYEYNDRRRNEISKGYTAQGIEFCMIEAQMKKENGTATLAGYEKGGTIVFGLGDQIAVVTIRHQSSGAFCYCRDRYNIWSRFFNSFTPKNFTSVTQGDNLSKKIVGAWFAERGGGNTLSNYIFAANNHYQYFGGFGSSRQIDAGTIENKSSAFKGDGTYSLNGNKLILKKPSRTETLQYRIEKVNYGGTGWKERLYILNLNPADGSVPYEIRLVREGQGQ